MKVNIDIKAELKGSGTFTPPPIETMRAELRAVADRLLDPRLPSSQRTELERQAAILTSAIAGAIGQ